MKTKINLSQLFINPAVWDSIIPIYDKDPFKEFNRLNINVKFDKSLNLKSLNQFFHELILHIKEENVFYVNNLVFGFIPILLSSLQKNNNILDSAFFQLSKEMFNNIYQRNQKYSSILIIVSLFDILYSKLPISISLGHLYHIQEEQAQLIHKYLYDGNANSIAVKCLTLSLSFPSSTFNKRHPDYPSYIAMLETIDPHRVQFFPDPTIMLDNHSYFTFPDLIYASFTVQYTTSLLFSIGHDQYLLSSNNNISDHHPSSLDVRRCLQLQDLLAGSELSLGCVSHSLLLHTTQPSSMLVMSHVLAALDCATGAELLKELAAANTTPSFARLVAAFGGSVLRGVFAREAETSQVLAAVLAPLGEGEDGLARAVAALVEMARADEDRRPVLPFLCGLHNVLLRFAMGDVAASYTGLVEHARGLAFVVGTFVEMLTLQPQFERCATVKAAACVIALMYRVARRFAVRALSAAFLAGTLECAYFLVHAPVECASFLLFDVQHAQDEMRQFVAQHEPAMRAYMEGAMPDMMLPAAAVVASFFARQDAVGAELLVRVVRYASRTYVQQVHAAARSALREFCVRASLECVRAFVKELLDLYLGASWAAGVAFDADRQGDQKGDRDDQVHCQTLYLLLVLECVRAREEVCAMAVAHPAFRCIYGDAQRQFAEMPAPYTPLICPLLAIVDAAWRGGGRAFDAAGVSVTSAKQPREQPAKGEEQQQPANDSSESDVVEIQREAVYGAPSFDFYAPEIDVLLMNVHFLWAPAATCLLSLALGVAERARAFPYAVQAAAVVESAADNRAEFLARLAELQPGDAGEQAKAAASRCSVANTSSNNSAAEQADFGLAWRGAPYEYDFIIAQKPVAVFAKNVTLPNSQVIDEGEYEEEEEEENDMSDSSEF